MRMARVLAPLVIAFGIGSACFAADSPAVDSTNLTTVLSATITPERIPAGAFFRLKLNWQAPKPLSNSYTVFIHYRDDKGKMVFQGDHTPPVGTATPGWTGTIRYENRVIVPANLSEATYKIVVGLYNKEGRLKLGVGKGVVDLGERSYQVGTFTIDKKAPVPEADTEKKPTLNLSAYKPTFSEEFDKPLDISPWGPGTRWIAHTPWHGDFGDAQFADPVPGFPFTIDKGILRIEARKDTAFKQTDEWKRSWKAGCLASNDPKGKGFSQQYGYFVMRAKLPTGPGVWPAFWLVSSFDKTDSTAGRTGSVEIDVIEYYGAPNAYTSGVHVWEPKPHHGEGSTVTTKQNEVSSGFHEYGVLVDPEWITMYFDKIEVWKIKTPAEHNKPLMLLANLALGGGWGVANTQSPLFMDVDYIRAYAKK